MIELTVRSQREEKLLEEIRDKMQSPGIVIWGEVEGKPGIHVKVKVTPGGKLVLSTG